MFVKAKGVDPNLAERVDNLDQLKLDQMIKLFPHFPFIPK